VSEIRVEFTRGGRTESVHRVSLVVVEGRRTLLARGDVRTPVFMRSCAKPFQSVTVIETGAADAFDFAAPEIAIMSGSHGGEAEQVDAVRSILRKAGLKPDALRCGVHPPTSPKALKALYRARQEPTVLHNNCSGKHSGMVSATKHLGEKLETYLEPSHPLQKRNRATIARFSGVPAGKIGMGTDGCSAPTFAVPLGAMARAIATLATEEGFARRVRESMMAHPGLVGRPCVNVMSAAPGRIVAKGGAEGVYLCGLAERNIGVALKVEDGNGRAWVPVLAWIFTRLHLLPKGDLAALGKASDRLLRNHAGIAVGEIRVAL
jgi:L-asparaginase II